MARSFLFAQTTADAATTRLIATAAQQTGFMKGEPGAPRDGWYVTGGDNALFLADLHAALVATYPRARPLRAVRLWTNLIWQPAYLSVIATHLHGALPALADLSQNRRGIYVDGFRLRPSEQWSGAVDDMITRAGADLAIFAQHAFAEVNRNETLKWLPARRLLAHRLLGLMVWLHQRRRDLAVETILEWSERWLAAAGLAGQGALELVPTADGQSVLIVRRKGCCLDYLVEPFAYCASCPKQDEAERLARQAATALAELG
jgi:siderophore ferric iron reductase